MIGMFDRLRYLAAAYFHQDYADDFDSPNAVVAAYVEDVGRSGVDRLCREIDDLIAQNRSEQELWDFWVLDLGGAYDPLADYETMYDWFTSLKDLVRSYLG